MERRYGGRVSCGRVVGWCRDYGWGFYGGGGDDRE